MILLNSQKVVVVLWPTEEIALVQATSDQVACTNFAKSWTNKAGHRNSRANTPGMRRYWRCHAQGVQSPKYLCLAIPNDKTQRTVPSNNHDGSNRGVIHDFVVKCRNTSAFSLNQISYRAFQPDPTVGSSG